MVHEHVVNRRPMQMRRSTAGDYLAGQERKKVFCNERKAFFGQWLVAICRLYFYSVECEGQFDGVKT